MISGMAVIAEALAPIFLLVLMGWGLRSRGLLPDSFWAPAEKLTYYVLFPALLVSNLAEARLAGLPVAEMVAALAAGTIIMGGTAIAAMGLLHRPPFHLDGPGFSSVFQGVIRPNTYVGIAAAAGLWGPPGLTLTAICVALVVPLVNVLSVVALVRWARPKGAPPRRWSATILPVVRNPLIAACLAGILLNVSGIGLPRVAGPFLKILGSASLPLGLLAVGAGLELTGLRRAGWTVAAVALAKLLLLPALVGGVAWSLGVRGLPLVVCAAYCGLPIAPNAYVLARQLGGDAMLMARLIAASTILAALTLPLVVSAAGIR